MNKKNELIDLLKKMANDIATLLSKIVNGEIKVADEPPNEPPPTNP